MYASTLLGFLVSHAALISAWSIPSSNTKRAAETDATLYAYGTSTSGWPISYGVNDGKLYISTGNNGSTSSLDTITFDIAAITGENWIANGTLANGTDVGSMYIMRESFNAVGMSPFADVDGLGGSAEGFALFATQLVYNNNSTLESQFWAQSTTTDGVYSLMWNPTATVETDSFPVVLKATENVSN